MCVEKTISKKNYCFYESNIFTKKCYYAFYSVFSHYLVICIYEMGWGTKPTRVL